MFLTQELDNLRSQSRTNIAADKLEILDKAAEKLGLKQPSIEHAGPSS